MLKKFLKSNKGTMIFTFLVLAFGFTAYHAQASDMEKPIPITFEIEAPSVEEGAKDLNFIQWVGDKYRVVLTKTATGYKAVKEAYHEKLEALSESESLASDDAGDDSEGNVQPVSFQSEE